MGPTFPTHTRIIRNKNWWTYMYVRLKTFPCLYKKWKISGNKTRSALRSHIIQNTRTIRQFHKLLPLISGETVILFLVWLGVRGLFFWHIKSYWRCFTKTSSIFIKLWDNVHHNRICISIHNLKNTSNFSSLTCRNSPNWTIFSSQNFCPYETIEVSKIFYFFRRIQKFLKKGQKKSISCNHKRSSQF